MRLYLAGADSSGDHLVLDGLKNLSLLVSYWYVKNGKGGDVIKWANERRIPVFLDSGAFSAMTHGEKINVVEYLEYCVENKNRFHVIANLDVIGDHVTTARNHDYMQSAGCDCITAFHVNSPFSELERLCSENDYIALGVAGMQKRRNQIMRWCAYCHNVAKKNKTKLHGFGLTSPIVMSSFPWFSVDSSTWLNGRRFGNLIVRIGNKFAQYGRHDWWKISGRFPHEIANNIGRNNTKEQYDPILRYNAKQMIDWAERYNRHEEKHRA